MDTSENNKTVSLNDAIHPYEQSRLTLAYCVVAVVVTIVLIMLLTSFGEVLAVAMLLAVGIGFIYFLLSVQRAQLLGSAVRVTPHTLPEIHAVLADVRRRLDYHRPVDVYVVAKVEHKAQWISLLGRRVILLEGEFVNGLQSAEGELRLHFLFGSFIGMLKARHDRLNLFLVLLSGVEALQIFKLLLFPYYRATFYTGDQLGYLCAGNLKSALNTIGTLMVGKEFAAQVMTAGVLDQVEVVQRDMLPRLAQIRSSAPHLVNRYLNILAFALIKSPDSFAEFSQNLDDTTRQRLTNMLAHSPHAAVAAPA